MLYLFVSMLAFAEESSETPIRTIEDFEITGEVQRPDLNMVMTRENLDRDYELELVESFIPKIIESMKTEPL
jgi:hypothetical protein